MNTGAKPMKMGRERGVTVTHPPSALLLDPPRHFAWGAASFALVAANFALLRPRRACRRQLALRNAFFKFPQPISGLSLAASRFKPTPTLRYTAACTSFHPDSPKPRPHPDYLPPSCTSTTTTSVNETVYLSNVQHPRRRRSSAHTANLTHFHLPESAAYPGFNTRPTRCERVHPRSTRFPPISAVTSIRQRVDIASRIRIATPSPSLVIPISSTHPLSPPPLPPHPLTSAPCTQLREDEILVNAADYKDNLARELQNMFETFTNQARFVKMIIDKELIVSNRKKVDILADLKRHKFRPFPKISKAKEAGETEDALEQEAEEEEEEEEEENEKSNASDYDYLLGMAIASLTKEKFEKLLQNAADKEQELLALLQISPKEMWNTDLDKFLAEWEVLKVEIENKAQLDANGKKIKKKQTVLRTRKSIGTGKGRKGDSDSEDDFKPIKAPKRKAPESKRPKPAAVLEDEDDDDDPPAPPPARKRPAAKKPVYDDDDDMDDDSDSEIEVVKPPSKKAKGKAIDSDDEDFDEAPKAKGKARAAPKRKSLDSALDSDDEPPKKKKSSRAQAVATDFFAKAGPSGSGSSEPEQRKTLKSMKPVSPPEPRKAPLNKLVDTPDEEDMYDFAPAAPAR
ncbi:hypothetical protein R3P38DRAFT_3266615 [Favolaschia claudopus]|uniref:DNA topoisomerase (ATP-hydrolyzing) n=1 Tax=Favolaschia claudopus TaxID=2862362 RepID=A0AAW0BS60_9AGAR